MEIKSNRGNVLCYKKPIDIWDVNVDNMDFSKLIETKTNSRYLVGYSEKVLIMPKMSGYVKTFKVKDGDQKQ